MEDETKQLQKFLLLQDNKKKIERLKLIYLPEEIKEAETGINNSYKKDLDALLVERQNIIQSLE